MGEENQVNTDSQEQTTVITPEMVNAAMFYFKAEDQTNADGIYGTLRDWEAGRGTLDAFLIEAPSRRELFAPLRNAYYAALGQEVPEYSIDTDEPVPSNPNEMTSDEQSS